MHAPASGLPQPCPASKPLCSLRVPACWPACDLLNAPAVGALLLRHNRASEPGDSGRLRRRRPTGRVCARQGGHAKHDAHQAHPAAHVVPKVADERLLRVGGEGREGPGWAGCRGEEAVQCNARCATKRQAAVLGAQGAPACLPPRRDPRRRRGGSRPRSPPAVWGRQRRGRQAVERGWMGLTLCSCAAPATSNRSAQAAHSLSTLRASLALQRQQKPGGHGEHAPAAALQQAVAAQAQAPTHPAPRAPAAAAAAPGTAAAPCRSSPARGGSCRCPAPGPRPCGSTPPPCQSTRWLRSRVGSGREVGGRTGGPVVAGCTAPCLTVACRDVCSAFLPARPTCRGTQRHAPEAASADRKPWEV